MPGKILTRDEYESVVYDFCGDLGDAIMRRWDAAAPVYGECDLTAKDFEREKKEEIIDFISWSLIEAVKKSRGYDETPVKVGNPSGVSAVLGGLRL